MDDQDEAFGYSTSSPGPNSPVDVPHEFADDFARLDLGNEGNPRRRRDEDVVETKAKKRPTTREVLKASFLKMRSKSQAESTGAIPKDKSLMQNNSASCSKAAGSQEKKKQYGFLTEWADGHVDGLPERGDCEDNSSLLVESLRNCGNTTKEYQGHSYERPTSTLRVIVKKLKAKHIEARKFLTLKRSLQTEKKMSEEESALQERRAVKMSRTEKLLKVIADRRAIEEKRKKSERNEEKHKRQSYKRELSKERTESQEKRKEFQHLDVSRKRLRQAEFRKLVEKSPETQIEYPLKVPAITVKSEIIDLTCDSTWFYCNLKFAEVDVSYFRLETVEDFHQKCTIKRVDQYLIRAATSFPTFGTQCTAQWMTMGDFAKIVAESLRDFQLLSKLCVTLKKRLSDELLEGNVGVKMHNEEVDEFSQHLQTRSEKVGEKLYRKIAKVEVRNFDFGLVLRLVSAHLLRIKPSIFLTVNLVCNHLAAMLKSCHVTTHSKTFEEFLREALQPRLPYTLQLPFEYEERVRDRNTTLSYGCDTREVVKDEVSTDTREVVKVEVSTE